MIPSRDLSLLVNRLAKGGGRRILEAVLERDYCLAWFLVGLSGSSLCGKLAFKGGTALKRCYIGEYRFSEDLDFTLTEPLELDEIVASLEAIFAAVGEASNVQLRYLGPDRHRHENTYTVFLGYEGPLPPRDSRVRVDITHREKLVSPLEMRPVLRAYDEFADIPEDAPVQAYSMIEISSEKVVALLDPARLEPRDLYDLWFLMTERYVQASDLTGPVEQKLTLRGRPLAECAGLLRDKEKRLARSWSTRLAAQMVSLPEFDGVYRTVRRELRQAGLAE